MSTSFAASEGASFAKSRHRLPDPRGTGGGRFRPSWRWRWSCRWSPGRSRRRWRRSPSGCERRASRRLSASGGECPPRTQLGRPRKPRTGPTTQDGRQREAPGCLRRCSAYAASALISAGSAAKATRSHETPSDASSLGHARQARNHRAAARAYPAAKSHSGPFPTPVSATARRRLPSPGSSLRHPLGRTIDPAWHKRLAASFGAP